MSDLIIITNIKTSVDTVDVVKAALQLLVTTTRKQPGCLKYDLHQLHDAPNHFVSHEIWTTAALRELHLKAPNMAEFKAETDGKIVETTHQELIRI